MDAVSYGAVPKPVARALDIAVGIEIGGYRWVTWDRQALRDAPAYTPGRFLAHQDDLLAHLHRPADATDELAEDALARLPRFSESFEDALQAAEDSGLFSLGEATLRRGPCGGWEVQIPPLHERVFGDSVAEVLCWAALSWARRDVH